LKIGTHLHALAITSRRFVLIVGEFGRRQVVGHEDLPLLETIGQQYIACGCVNQKAEIAT
jgi:hypothetical protein